MNKPAVPHSGRAMQACIEACSRCHEICLQNAINHCLETGGKHVTPKHFRLLINCAEICQTWANFRLGSYFVHPRVCEVCACAADCEKLGGIDECVAATKACAESCVQLALA